MKIFTYVCDICESEKEQPEGKRPPVCCRKIMRKKYYPVGIIYKTDGFTGAQKDDN